MQTRKRTRARGGPRKETPPPEATGWSRRQRALAIIAALLVIAVLVLWKSKKASAPEREQAETDQPEHRPLNESHSKPEAPAVLPSASADPATAEPAPVIDSITLEKTSVCSGEENLVTIKAHTLNGTDDSLHYVVDGEMGQAYPLRIWKTDKGVGTHFVSVFGRGNVATTVPLPDYEVRDCKPVRVVNIETHLRSNTWSDFELVAKLVVPHNWNEDKRIAPAKPFEPVSYVWSFGDGTSVVTSVPQVEHDYEGRQQSSLYSYYLLGVEVHGKDGEVISGRTSLSLTNPAFESLATKGIVVLMIALDPRFPEMKEGRVTQRVRMWHNRPGPVTIETMMVTKYFEGASGESAPEMVEVASVLGTTMIPAGKDGITATLILDPSYEQGVFSKTYRVGGKSEEGYPVSGSFGVMKPPPAPTKDNHDPVLDPMLKAKIIAARQMLGKNTVTDEDIWQLERQGKFANLAPANTAGTAATARPAPVPRAPAAAPGPAVPVDPTSQAAPPVATGAPKK